MNECQNCPRYTRDNRNLCHICEDRVTEFLDEIPGLFKALESLVHVKRPRNARRAPVEASTPCNIDALSLTATGGIPDILTSWVEDWYALLDWDPPAWDSTLTDRVTSAVHRLRVNLPWAAEEHPAADDFAREIAHLHRQARRVIDGDTPHIPLGTCSCGGRITANPTTLAARCPDCREEWRGAQLADLAENLKNTAKHLSAA